MIENEYINRLISNLNLITDKIDIIDRKIDTLLSVNPKRDNVKKSGLCEERVIDSVELCEILHVTNRTLLRYRKEKSLPFYKLKRRYYYKTSDVLRFLENYHKAGE